MSTVSGANLLQAILDAQGIALLPDQQTDLENALQELIDSGQDTAFALADMMSVNPQITGSLEEGDNLATIVNDSVEAIELGAPDLIIDDVSVTEGDAGTTTATFTVTLSDAPGAGEEVTVDYDTADGTATTGDDYVAATGILTFAEGETTQTIEVTVNGDTEFEADETFNVVLDESSIVGTIGGEAVVINDATGVGTITNDDEETTGETFTLTTGVDTFTGAAGDDTFNAAVLTANDGDTLDGGLGADVLNVETASSITDKFVTTGIETVNLNALGAVTVDTKSMTGLTTFNSSDAAGAVTVNNIADAATAFGIKGSATNNIDLNYAAGALSGTDKLMVSLNGSSSTTISSDSGFESAEVMTTAASSLTALTGSGATALTLSGSADLSVAAAAIDSFSDYTITNTGKVTLDDVLTIKSLNASANTGGIVAKNTQTTTTALDYTIATDKLEMATAGGLIQTGSGNDNINVDSDAVFSTNSTIVKLGAGDDKLSLSSVSSAGEYIYGEAGNDLIYVGAALTSSDLIDGGEGTDTVNFIAGTHSLIAKGIENVGVNGAGATTVSFVTTDTATAIADGGAGAVTFSNLLNGSTYTASAAKTGLTTLGFKTGQAATIDANFTKGTTGGLTTTNAAAVTATYGAASDVGAAWTLDSTATSLTIAATGALSATTGQDIAASSTSEKLQTVTITGDKAIKLGDITNNDSLTSVSVKSTGGSVTLDDINASDASADQTISKIEVSSSKGGASFGAGNTSDFTGTTTVTGSVAEITASASGGGSTDTAAIGDIAADKIGAISATSTTANVTIGALTVGLDTATDYTDGTITSINATGLLAASVGAVKADSIGSIVVASTDTTTGGAVSIGDITDANGTGKGTVGAVTMSTKVGAATLNNIKAATLGNVAVSSSDDLTTKLITVTNTDNTSETGNISLTTSSSTTGTDILVTDTISVEKGGDLTAKSTGGAITVTSAKDITYADTTGANVSLTAKEGIEFAGLTTITNTKGDLSVTMASSAGGANAADGTLSITAGTETTFVSDIDLVANFSSVTGAVGYTNDTKVVITNEGTDSASTTVVTGGAAANFIKIDGATGTSSQTISYQGQSGADTVTLTGKYASSTITTEAGADDITGGAGLDTINAGAGNDIFRVTLAADLVTNEALLGGTGTDALYLLEGAVYDLTKLSSETDNLVTEASIEQLVVKHTDVTLDEAVSGTALTVNTAGAVDLVMTVGMVGTTFDASNFVFTALDSIADVTETELTAADKMVITGTTGADTITAAGTISNSITGGTGADTITLQVNTTADKVVVAAGDSLAAASSYDNVTNFAVNEDILDLAGTFAKRGSGDVDGTDSGTVKSDRVDSNGLITFDDADTFNAAISINSANLADVLGYLTANVTTAGETVMFQYDVDSDGDYTSGDAVFVFQAGATNTLVELVGINASGYTTLAATAGANTVAVI